MGLTGSQFGLVGNAATEQSGILIMLTEPGEVPLPAFATTSSARVGAKSAQMGATPTGMVLTGVSSWLVCELTTLTVLSALLRMKARLTSAGLTPYPRP